MKILRVLVIVFVFLMIVPRTVEADCLCNDYYYINL